MLTSRDTIALVPSDRPGRKPDATRIAAIDVGSNSIRQIIADVSADGAIAVVDELTAGPRRGESRTAVVDRGGGSLELALSLDGVVDRLMSLPLGAVRLTEAFLSKKESERRIKALKKHVRSVIRDNVPKRPWRGARLIGAGGTFTNLAGIVLHRQGMESAKSVQGAVVSRSDAEHVLDPLSSMSVEERRQVPGLNEARADIIVAGLTVIVELMARLDVRELEVSRYGIREGLLLEAARVQPQVADPGEARAKSINELAERCNLDKPHAKQVQMIALKLFDAIGSRIGCDSADRQTLADAALLHDSGYHISYERHHKHSYHLIVHADLLGVDPIEQVVIASVARYHRGEPPRRRHKVYGGVEKPVRTRIRRLAALLRLADGLDRGHMGAINDVKVRFGPDALRISPIPRSSRERLRLELWGAHRKSELLAEVSGLPVEIVGPDRAVLSSDAVDESAA